MNNLASPSLTLRCDLHIQPEQRGRLRLHMGKAKTAAPAPVGRVPRISRLMALAIRFDDLLRRGEMKDYAELAHVGHVTRARVTQITNLLMLAPDIQEQILFLAPAVSGRDAIKEWQVRPIAGTVEWGRQRKMWAQIMRAR